MNIQFLLSSVVQARAPGEEIGKEFMQNYTFVSSVKEVLSLSLEFNQKNPFSEFNLDLESTLEL